jgi:peptidyl-tRNA hydrolase, PTH1 family
MIIVGLGNPGSQYVNTKHNAGYWVIDKLADEFSLKFKLGKGDYMHTKNSDICLVKPLGYMNNSGIALKNYMDYFNVDINQILVVYDDADLPLGKIRFKSQGSSGGQKGIDSIIYHLKNDQFLRLKVGIATNKDIESLASYVLSPFDNKDSEVVSDVVGECVNAIKFLIKNNITETMNKYNMKYKENN